MPKALMFHGRAFAPLHRRLVGVEIDFAALDPAGFAPELAQQAATTWQERVRTEYRSAQLMNQLLAETLSAGDPFDVHAGMVELLADELRHVALCAGLVTALGQTPLLPEPLALTQPAQFMAMPADKRALSIALSLLLVNETLSVGYIRDLLDRCRQPVVRAVLAATLADEAEHDAFGLEYVRRALVLQPEGARDAWRGIAAQALRPQRERAERVLHEMPRSQRNLEAWPDEREVELGLFTLQRQALVYERTYAERLGPRLRELQLL